MKFNPNEHVKITFAVIGVNLLIILLYQSITLYVMHRLFFTSAICIIAHMVVLGMSAAIINTTRYNYLAYGLGISVPVVALLGFGTCAIS
jgi:hypothetical protein